MVMANTLHSEELHTCRGCKKTSPQSASRAKDSRLIYLEGTCCEPAGTSPPLAIAEFQSFRPSRPSLFNHPFMTGFKPGQITSFDNEDEDEIHYLRRTKNSFELVGSSAKRKFPFNATDAQKEYWRRMKNGFCNETDAEDGPPTITRSILRRLGIDLPLTIGDVSQTAAIKRGFADALIEFQVDWNSIRAQNLLHCRDVVRRVDTSVHC